MRKIIDNSAINVNPEVTEPVVEAPVKEPVAAPLPPVEEVKPSKKEENKDATS